MRYIVLIAALITNIRVFVCQNCTCSTSFFAHGASANDTFIEEVDDISIGLPTVAVPFVYYGIGYDKAYVSTNGVISFGSGYDAHATKCQYPNRANAYDYTPVLFIYWDDLDNRQEGNVTFRINDSVELLTTIDNIIQGCTGDVIFTSNVSLVATWHMVQRFGQLIGTRYTFQATLATNGVDTYMITSYENLTYVKGEYGGIGGQNNDRTKGFNHPYSCHNNTYDILTSSNYGCPGSYIVKISDEPAYREFIDPVCQSDSCKNGGTCKDFFLGHTCLCEDGFDGQQCENDIDDCLLNPCENNATCVDEVGNYTCICADGYEGENCTYDIDDCLLNPCENNATCVDEVGNYTCICADGYEGKNCTYDIDECRSQPCQNGATCIDWINSYSCQCDDGWSGSHCGVDVNECLNSPCLNGGSCQNTPGNFTCTCDVTEWAGTRCQIRLVFDPVVNSSSPNKGPVAGGTRITVKGNHLPARDPIFVHIGTLDCTTMMQNKTTVIVLSPSVNESDTSLIGVDLPMAVRLSGGRLLPLKEKFLYKGNPKIASFQPNVTIVTGGTQITVSGENFDAVEAPAVRIIVTYYKAISKDPVKYNVSTTTNEGPCKAEDAFEMLCQIPQIILPDDFKNDPDSNSPHNSGESRRKRNTENFECRNGEDCFTVYVGFVLDGVKDFENVSGLEVFPEPTFDSALVGPDTVLPYKPGERIGFQGDKLDVGIMESDYSIDIGKSVCGSLELLSNSLSCLPPNEKPQLDSTNHESHPKIIINVGLYVQHDAGYLEYPDRINLHIMIPAAILPVMVIIAVTIIIVCLMRRKRQKTNEEVQKTLTRVYFKKA